MTKLLFADMHRMYRSKRFLLCVLAMAAVSVSLIFMQYTAMDYVVKLDRVIFLPMSFYGIASAATVALFVGDDFNDGVIRNKLIACNSRTGIYGALLFTAWAVSLTIYLITILLTTGIGILLFENNLTFIKILHFTLLGAFMCLAYGSIFCMFAILIGNKANAVTVCMVLSFVMLFLSLHTNQTLVQDAYKNGVPNPHYVSGIKRTIYELLHDLNPTGQAAQLSCMSIYNITRWLLCDLFWVTGTTTLGIALFQRKDIR